VSAIQLASEHDFPAWESRSRFQQGWALAEQGQIETSLSLIKQAMEERHSFGTIMPEEYVIQAEALLKKQDITEALAALTACQELTDIGGNWFEAEGVRLKGECLLTPSMDQQDEAESCFRQALEIARSQQAKSWELRAATSLVRLWRSQGRRKDAYDLLAPVYNWFTEGFDTADLQEARALLEALS
jgi:predicted ATPase